MNTNEQIKQLPESLQSPVQLQWQSFIDSGVDVSSLPAEVSDALAKVWACSDFVMQTCVRFPQQFLELATSGDLQKSYSDDHYKTSIITELKHNDESELSHHLRVFRRRDPIGGRPRASL